MSDSWVGKKILIIEDEPAYQHALTERLTQEGFSVSTAKDGTEGLALALQNHPDIILLDIQMPHMNGLEMAKKLREDPWGKQAKIIILTNSAGTEKVADALETNIYDYLVKSDTTLEDLVKKIKNMLG